MRVLLFVCVVLQHFGIQVVGQANTNVGYLDPCKIPGNPGLPGDHGLQGRDGNQGRNGYTGQKGEYGLLGTRGRYGPPGKIGQTGSPGQPGEEGLYGSSGLEGYSGYPGNNGEKGLPGVAGGRGKTGSPGIKGDPGTGDTHEDNIVAFTVARATSMFARASTGLDFTHILSDLNGNFDMVNDSFTCPISGVYLFSFSFESDSTATPSVSIVRNSTHLLNLHSTSAFSVIQTSTNMLVLNLMKGDVIWLRLQEGSGIHCRNKMLCSFTGVLLQGA